MACLGNAPQYRVWEQTLDRRKVRLGKVIRVRAANKQGRLVKRSAAGDRFSQAKIVVSNFFQSKAPAKRSPVQPGDIFKQELAGRQFRHCRSQGCFNLLSAVESTQIKCQ